MALLLRDHGALLLREGSIWKFNGGTWMYNDAPGVIGMSGKISHLERPQAGTILGREERCMRHVNGQYQLGFWRNGVWLKNMDINPEESTDEPLLSRMEIEKYPEIPIEIGCMCVKFDVLKYLRNRELGSRKKLFTAFKKDHI